MIKTKTEKLDFGQLSYYNNNNYKSDNLTLNCYKTHIFRKDFGLIMKDSLVSVIVPIFNTFRFLEKCVLSILRQSYKNLEVILIDDGSTDGSFLLCNQLLKKDSRIKVFHKQNGGLSSAKNFGLDHATGEYICFVDSDDWIEPNMIELLLDTMIKNNSDMAMCSFFMENETGEIYADCPKLENKTYLKNDALSLLNGPRQDRFVVSWNKLYKNSLFDDIRFPNKFHEDQWIVHKLLLKTNSVSTVSNLLYHYVVRENSIMQSKNPIIHLDDIDAIFDRIDTLNLYSLSTIAINSENALFETFKFYKEKFLNFANFNTHEFKAILTRANECRKYFKFCMANGKVYTKEEIKSRNKTYGFTLYEKIKLKHGKKLKTRWQKWKKKV